jgi:hypothetical protein
MFAAELAASAVVFKIFSGGGAIDFARALRNLFRHPVFV